MKLAALALVVGLTACGPLDTYIEDRLSAAELALYDANLRVVEDTQADIEATEQQILTLSANIRSMAEDMNAEGVRLGLMQLSQKQQDYSKMVANYRKAADDAKELLESHIHPAVQGLLGILDPIVPVPLQPLVPLASSLAVMLLSKRSRKHTVQGLKGLAKGNLGELGGYVLKAVGASHTSKTTKLAADIEEAGKVAVVKSAD